MFEFIIQVLGTDKKRFDRIRQGCFTALCSQKNVRSATWMLISAMIVFFVTFCICIKKRLFEHLSENLDLWRQYYYMYKSGYWIRHRCLNVSLRHFIPTFVDSLTNQSYFVFISYFLYTWKYLPKIFASNLILKRFQI